jgi:hypothetical protein
MKKIKRVRRRGGWTETEWIIAIGGIAFALWALQRKEQQ